MFDGHHIYLVMSPRHGKCFRLYSEESFNRSLLKVTVPEILRSNLASVSLQMKAMGIEAGMKSMRSLLSDSFSENPEVMW